METFVFPVRPEHVRSITDPNSPSIKTTYALVNVLDLPPEIPLSPNPRVPKTNRVTRRIVDSLMNWDGVFHLLNRGITISAKAVEYDNRAGELRLVIPEDDHNYGILDGGHTKWSIAKALERKLPDDDARRHQFVRLEILEGVEDILPRVASARNFSENVDEVTLKTYEHKLDWLKDAVGDLKDKVSWFQNDEGKMDAIELLQILCAMNRYQFPRTKHPLEAYKNAGKCLEYATDPDDQYRYKWLAPIVLDIWRLYDEIRVQWWDKYRLPDPDTGRFGRPRATAESSTRKRGKAKLMQYVTLDRDGDPSSDLHVEKGLAFPLLAGFRALLDDDQSSQRFRWKTDPLSFFELHGQVLVRKIMDASDQRGNNPHTVGRDPTVYDSTYEAIELRYLRAQRQD